MILEAEASITIFNNFLFGTISKHFFSNSQCFSQGINIVILHFFLLNNLNLSSSILTLHNGFLELLLFLKFIFLDLLSTFFHFSQRLRNHIGIIIWQLSIELFIWIDFLRVVLILPFIVIRNIVIIVIHFGQWVVKLDLIVLLLDFIVVLLLFSFLLHFLIFWPELSGLEPLFLILISLLSSLFSGLPFFSDLLLSFVFDGFSGLIKFF